MSDPLEILKTSDPGEVKRIERWAAEFIREHVDVENRFLPGSLYELAGKDLQRALVAAYMIGQGAPRRTAAGELLRAAKAFVDMRAEIFPEVKGAAACKTLHELLQAIAACEERGVRG